MRHSSHQSDLISERDARPRAGTSSFGYATTALATQYGLVSRGSSRTLGVRRHRRVHIAPSPRLILRPIRPLHSSIFVRRRRFLRLTVLTLYDSLKTSYPRSCLPLLAWALADQLAVAGRMRMHRITQIRCSAPLLHHQIPRSSPKSPTASVRVFQKAWTASWSRRSTMSGCLAHIVGVRVGRSLVSREGSSSISALWRVRLHYVDCMLRRVGGFSFVAPRPFYPV